MAKRRSKTVDLRVWVCDWCGEVIGNVSEGWFEWYLVGIERPVGQDLRIVHNASAPNGGCQLPEPPPTTTARIHDMSLADFLDRHGVQALNDFEERGTFPLEIIERFRRRRLEGDRDRLH